MDDELFKKAMADVKPLDPKFQNRLNLKKPKTTVYQAKPSDIADITEIHYQAIAAETILSFNSGAISQQQFNHFKKGRQPIQARLDLHQHTLEQAQQKLKQFIEYSINQKMHCVLIIHGKGNGIIKGLTKSYLSQSKNILAFHSAIASDGGAGAVYVLL